MTQATVSESVDRGLQLCMEHAGQLDRGECPVQAVRWAAIDTASVRSIEAIDAGTVIQQTIHGDGDGDVKADHWRAWAAELLMAAEVTRRGNQLRILVWRPDPYTLARDCGVLKELAERDLVRRSLRTFGLGSLDDIRATTGLERPRVEAAARSLVREGVVVKTAAGWAWTGHQAAQDGRQATRDDRRD